MSSFSSVLAYGSEISTSASLDASPQAVAQSPATIPAVNSMQSVSVSTPNPVLTSGEFPSDGVYLYGQSAKPDQIGKTYAVFEVRGGKLVGALYMPFSSFDCFYGTFHPNELALTIVDSYDRTSSPYAIALERNYPVATGGNPAIANFKLQGFHALTGVGANDQRILNACRADYQQQLSQ